MALLDQAAGEGCLSGMLVIELGSRAGCAVAGSALAQLGATVILIEQPGTGGEGPQAHLKTACRAQFTAGKLSATLALDDEDGRATLRRWMAASDAVLLSSDSDAHRCRDLLPALQDDSPGKSAVPVVCELTAFGTSGPLQGLAYSDMEIQALTGILDATGEAGAAPTPIGLPLVEHIAGLYAAAGVVSALRQRRMQGFAQQVEISLYDVAFSAMTSFLAPAFVAKQPSGSMRVGNRHTMAAPWNVYQASDGWLLLCSGSDEQWQRLCALIERPELRDAPGFTRNADRVANVAQVDATVQAWVGRRSIDECVQAFSALGLPCGGVASIDGHPREANLDFRQMVRTAHDPVAGRQIDVPGSVFAMTRTPGGALLRIPSPGEDTVRIEALLRERQALPPPRRDAGTGQPTALPFAGLRVLEVGHYTTVPIAARSLAALGAEVIKIEPPEGEAVRRWPPAQNGQGVFFTFQNSDKKSVALDLETSDGRDALKRLIASADLLVENLKPGALGRKGFSPEEVRKLNPRLVYCSISGFGAHSLYPGRAAFDTVIQAMSGLMDVTRVGTMPMKTGPSIADVMGAACGLLAMVAALDWRDRTGAGQYLDLSMQDMAAWSTQTAWNGGRGLRPDLGAVRCGDGYVLADVRACEQALGAPLADFAALHSRGEVAAQMQSIGTRAVPVLSIHEVVHAPQTRERGLWFTARGEAGEFPLLALPMRLSRTPPQVLRVAPPLGSDNTALLAGSPLAAVWRTSWP